MSLKGFSIFSSGGHYVKPSTTILAYWVMGHPRNISMKLFKKWSIGLEADIIEKFFISNFSSDSHLVYQSGTILPF